MKLQFVHLKFQVKTKNWHLSNVITPPLLNTIILSLKSISLYGCPVSSTFFTNLKNNLLWIWNFRTLYWRLKNYYPHNLVLCNLKVIFFWCIRITKEIEVWEYELCMVCELFSWIRKSYKKLLILIHTHHQNYTKFEWKSINLILTHTHQPNGTAFKQKTIVCFLFTLIN